ncbi:MAG: RICIN domain-containing protein, partial [Clostridia bacterium]|nr:RICIN domain-containing protein [Clostridia bacterium]
MKKRILAMLLALSTILSVLNFSTVAYAVSINDSSAFIKQSPSHCTHASAVNMLRRRAIIDGLSNWNSITESSTSSALWAGGLYNSFTYSGMSASVYSLSGDKKATLISELANHPEGIVIYHTGSDQHAVLLTSYDSSTDTFYCFDPIPSKPNYIIPLTSAYLPGSTQSAKISSLHYYWKLTNKSGYPYVDLGTNFFGVILNTACWKPIECGSDGIVRLQAETGKSNQVWYFVRQSDGSYVINSASNGKALEMYNGITTNGTAVQVHDADWGGNYQRWYIYPQGSGYIIKSKHYQELNKVLDLNGGSTVNGNVIDTYTQNNTAAQIWSIYKADDVQLKAPTLSVTAGKSATNTKFSWSQVYGETYYILNIKKNGSTYKNIEGIYDTSYSINLPSGSYTATVQAANYYHGKTSTSVSFTVTDSTYTVTLNNQSPTTCGTTSVTATYGLAMPKITVPTKTGHTFGGYYTGTNGSGTQYYKADGTSARNWDKTAITTLYAKWTPNKYTVTFKNHDGTV